MNEKAGIASSQDYGKDEDAATKALTKHKVSWMCIVHSDLGKHTYCTLQSIVFVLYTLTGI